MPTPPPQRKTTATESFWVLGSALGFVGLGWLLFGSGGNDDSHVTYWAAHALAEHGRLVDYNGEAVEQSSSLAQVVLLALAAKLTPMSIPTIGWLTGQLFGVLTIHQAVRLARRVSDAEAWLAAPLTATASSLMYWSTSGMEGSMMAFAGLLLLSEASRLVERPGLSTAARATGAVALLITVRPEGVPVLLCVAAAALAAAGFGRRPSAWVGPPLDPRGCRWLGGIALVGGAVLVLGRVLMTGMTLPNPALSKDGVVREGVVYLVGSLLANDPVLLVLVPAGCLVALRPLVGDRGGHAALLLTASYVLAYGAFIIGIGGGWMGGYRHIVPVFPVMVVLVVGLVARWAPGRLATRLGLAGLCVLQLARTVQFASGPNNNGRPALLGTDLDEPVRQVLAGRPYSFAELANRSHLRDATLLPELLDVVRQLEPSPTRPLTLMSGQAGMLPYHAFREHFGELRFLDLYSITTPALRRCIPRQHVYRGVHGAQVHHDYVLRHPEQLARCGLSQPDIVFSDNLSPPLRRTLEANGFVVVHQQSGAMNRVGWRGWWTSRMAFSGFIAVRGELADRLRVETVHHLVAPESSSPHRTWHGLPCLDRTEDAG